MSNSNPLHHHMPVPEFQSLSFLLVFRHTLLYTLLPIIHTPTMPPTTRHWTTALIQVIAPLCLSAKLPWQLAFIVPALLLVDLYRRSQTLKREPIRAITIGEEKRKVRRLNGDRDITHQREVVCGIVMNGS